jgi:hypothetical protein
MVCIPIVIGVDIMASQVSNILLRFTWALYIPAKGPDMMLRSFIVAVLEILRRWQWNFCMSLPEFTLGFSY